ncbi:MAG: hypothetical protein ACLFU7_12245 [Armatimonadota bacterium]
MHHHGQRVVAAAAEAPGFPWLIVWLVARGEEASEGTGSSEREVEENLDGQILAMLHQAGGSMLQTEIAANLNVSTECVACALRDMVDSGRVHRKWEAGRYTYRIVHRDAQPQTS